MQPEVLCRFCWTTRLSPTCKRTSSWEFLCDSCPCYTVAFVANWLQPEIPSRKLPDGPHSTSQYRRFGDTWRFSGQPQPGHTGFITQKKLMILMMRKLGSDGRHTTASFCSCCSMETLMSTRLTKTSFQCVTAFHFSVSVGRLTSLSGLQFWKRAQGVAHWMSFQMSWFLEVVRRGVLNAFLTWRLDARATSLLVNGKANLSFRSPIFAASSAVCTCLIISLVCWNSMGLTLGALLLLLFFPFPDL